MDINQKKIPPLVRNHPRIMLIEGDACDNIDRVKEACKESERILVIEDSSHEYHNTLNILRTFAPVVTKGSYLIVEDSVCHHGLDCGPSPGPYEAIEDFIKENNEFEINRKKERFLITWNIKGYLCKVR